MNKKRKALGLKVAERLLGTGKKGREEQRESRQNL